MEKLLRNPVILLLLVCFSANPLLAAQVNSSGVKTGLVAANYTGSSVATGSFVSLISLEGEVILTQTERQNFVLTSTIALDGKDTRTRYFYVGLGQRYFLNGVSQNQSGDYAKSLIDYQPRTLWYAGWDVGLSQILLIPFGDVLASYATMGEVGASFGVRKNITRQFSIDGRLGASVGSGVSNNSVLSQVFRGMIGVVYFF